MVDTIKFSQMTNGGNINNNNITPSVLSGENVILNNPWTFLPPGTTVQRPPPSVTINYRLRFNTDDQLYEYYDAFLGSWVQLHQSAFTPGPFVTYEADASLPDAQNLGSLADGILRQTIAFGSATLDIAVNGTDYFGPGFIIPVADGGTGLGTIPANHILYSPFDNVLAILPTANNSVLITDDFFNISWSPFLPANLDIPTPIIRGTNGNIVAQFIDNNPFSDNLTFASGVSFGAQAGIYGTSFNPDVTIAVFGKGTGGVNIGSTGATTAPIFMQVGSNQITFSVPTLTAPRILTFPDANVTLTAGTMANAPVNTNITSMIGLTGVLQQPTAIQDTSNNNVLSFNYRGTQPDWIQIQNGDDSGGIPANEAGLFLQSSNANAALNISGKGTAGVNITCPGANGPMAISNGTNKFFFSVPTWTGNHTLVFPDANVTLVPGTMANAPINTNITEMDALTTIKGANGFNVVTFADDSAATDYLLLQSGSMASFLPAGIYLQSSLPNAPLVLAAKGADIVLAGGIGSTSPFGLFNGTNTYVVSVPTWTGDHSITLPDGDVALVPGTMATTSQIVIWNDVSGTSQSASVNNAYVIGNAAQTTVTLPATAPIGSVVSVAGQGAGGWILAANGGQSIKMAASSTSVGGALTSAEQYDSISVVCVVADTTWVVESAITTGFTIS